MGSFESDGDPNQVSYGSNSDLQREMIKSPCLAGVVMPFLELKAEIPHEGSRQIVEVLTLVVCAVSMHPARPSLQVRGCFP